MDTFLQRVIVAYKEESNNIGFIPKPRLEKDYRDGKFFQTENGFVLVGSLKSEVTPIHAVYVYPEKRNGSVEFVKDLLKLLPNKKYRVRCHFGQTFWKRQGLMQVRVEEGKIPENGLYMCLKVYSSNSNLILLKYGI